MNGSRETTLTSGPGLKPWLLASLLLHASIIVLLSFAPGQRDAMESSLRMVRLVGGGNNKPGWVRPQVQPRVPEQQQQAARERLRNRQETKPEERPEIEPVPKQVEEASPVEQAPARTAEPVVQNETKASEPVAAEEPPEATRSEEVGQPEAVSSSPDSRAEDRSEAGAAGQGQDRTGALADEKDSPALGAYLRRVEMSVNRSFAFPSRGSGRKAVYHFFIGARGSLEDLQLLQSSGLPALDMAGERALRRAVYPHLPRKLPFKKLGVTYSFLDE